MCLKIYITSRVVRKTYGQKQVVFLSTSFPFQDGTIDLIPLDYQTIQAGSGVADLLYFIFSGSDAEFRATHYQKLIDRYYHSLSTTLRRLRLNPDKIYSREDFDYELQQV